MATAELVAEAIEAGLKKVLPDAEYVKVPMADGGEGTVQSLVDATEGRLISAEVRAPLGNKVRAEFGLSGDGRTAIIEMAAASGLHLVPPEARNPLRTTSYGTGELILAALAEGARLASKLALNTRVPNMASSRTPERTNTRERIHSANAMTQNRNRVINDIASSVSSLRLTITRSYTCSMYSVGESISTLATMLNTPTTRNSRRKVHSAWVSSLR